MFYWYHMSNFVLKFRMILARMQCIYSHDFFIGREN